MQSAKVLQQRHGMVPTGKRGKNKLYHVGCTVGKSIIHQLNKSEPKRSREAKCHTWRSCGTEGAGNENLPRATTAWNSQSGTKIILHINDN